MKFSVLQYIKFVVICGSLRQINGVEIGSCADKCLFEAEIKNKDKCDKMSSDSLMFYYDPKTDSCLSSKCLYDFDLYFKTDKECTAKCSSCGRLWKKYKPEDNCLKRVQIQAFRSESSPPATNPTNIWTFDRDIGKCVENNIYHSMLKKDWYVEEGFVAELTKDECEKKCPPI